MTDIAVLAVLAVLAFGFLGLAWMVWTARHDPDRSYRTSVTSLFSTGSGRFLPSDKGRRVTVDGQACEIVEVLSATSITIRPIK